MTLKLSEKQIQMLKDYEHLLDSPFADGYSFKAFESKYKTTTKKVRELYKQYKKDLKKESLVIKCPYCGFESDDCDFPDIVCSGDDTTKEQLEKLQELQAIGYNIVTCGMCGEVIITKKH